MSIDSLGGMISAFDQQTFGSEMATKNMDTMSGLGSNDSTPPTSDKESFGAAVVSKTLDYMNSGGGGFEMSQTYDFSKSVLSSDMTGKGALTDMTV